LRNNSLSDWALSSDWA